MCNKCKHGVIDGAQVRINGDVSKMTKQDMAAMRQLIKISENYVKMKLIQNMKEAEYRPIEEPPTIEQRAENYANTANMSAGTYRGDVVTAYCIGAEDQVRAHREKLMDFLDILYLELKDREKIDADIVYGVALNVGTKFLV